MSYTRLTAGRGMLARNQRLEPQRVELAEQTAALWIDQHFTNYDRGSWSASAAPLEVQRIARMVAEAEYLRLERAAGNPHSPMPQVDGMRATARALTQEALRMDHLTGPDGQPIYPRERRGMHGRVVR